MFSKTLCVSLCLVSFGIQANAHAIVVPALGVKGKGARSDVQRPSTANPCGKTAVSALSSSTAANADAQGNVPLTVTNFNAGADGSRKVAKAQVDPTGTGKSFFAATVVTNGNAAPGAVGSDNISVQLPAGTKCTGAGGLCLMSLTTTAGFGNCVAVKQVGAAAGAANAAATAPVANAAGNVAGATATVGAKNVKAASSTCNAAGASKGAAANGAAAKDATAKVNAAAHSGFRDPAVKAAAMKADKKAAKPAGARAARAFLSSAGGGLTKRSGAFSWIWA